MLQTEFSCITPNGDLILPIPESHIDRIWPKVSSYLDRAIKRQKRKAYTIDDLKDLCLKKEMTLWVVDRDNQIIASVLTEVQKLPQEKVLSIPWVGGKDLKSWLVPMMTILEKYGRHFKCDFMAGYGRKGWMRAAGFESLHETFARPL